MKYYSLKTKSTPQKKCTFFTVADGLVSENVRVLAFSADGCLYAGTENGLVRFNGKSFEAVEGISAEVGAIFGAPDNSMYVGAKNTVYRIENNTVVSKQELDADVVEITSDDTGKIWLATVKTCFYLENGSFVRLQSFDFEATSCMTAFGDRQVFAACDKALLMLHGKRPRWSTLMPHMCNTPRGIRTLASDSLGYVWAGTDNGVYLYDGKKEWITPADLDFFPKTAINKIVFGSDSTIYFATEIGVYVVNGWKNRFLGKGRYLLSEKASDVAVKSDNSEYWIATDKGVTRVELIEMTLARKEEYFESKMHHFYREGYYGDVELESPDMDIEDGTVEISDNDGLWSAIYLGALCFKYAATGDREVKEKARDTMKALIKLQTMTGIKGFPARSYRRPGEKGFGNGHHEWHPTEDAKGPVEWKGETSSDELAGHYFGAAYYYDLVADEDEKEEIRASIKSVTDHLIEHEYTLCDADGLPTTWAHFGPQELNDEELWCWEKGINSLELVSFMRITEHLTGEKKYGDIADELIKKHHYGMNLLLYKRYDEHANHIDDLLGILCVLPLLEYEKDEVFRKYILLALRRHYEYEKIEHYPLYAFGLALFTGGHTNLNDCIETLEDYPLDLHDYPQDFSKRPDLEINYGPQEYADDPQSLYALPADERALGILSYTAFSLVYGYNWRYVMPIEWLLCYWFGRYYGMIEE
ncbi:MAG: hypothetical protein IJE93_03550 [Clostridia bacterium]|nr:hypothetical protein [Clostridia bacterium]